MRKSMPGVWVAATGAVLNTFSQAAPPVIYQQAPPVQQVDTAAEFLKQLQDAHTPVLWRPMHENNGGFFWWGGRPGQFGTAQLYRELYDRMVDLHHLDNLLWVWNQNGPATFGEFHRFFPGPNFVDVVSDDKYRSLDDKYYWELPDLANGKPIALREVGVPPPAEVLKAQTRWIWFMDWAGGVDRRVDELKAAYGNPSVISRGDPLPK
jgi:mannan endo-1,4-beta-mannosidase